MLDVTSLSKAQLVAEVTAQRHQLRQQDIELQTKDQTILQLEQERDEYKLAFDKLMQQRFRNHSERYIDNPDQLRLDFGDTDEAADAACGLADAVEDLQQTIPEHQRRRPRRKRDESLPAHLPRYEITATVSPEEKTCPTHGERTLLPESMWDTTETLEFERPSLKVRVTRYPKYACQNKPECGIASPERPPSIVEGNKYAPSVAAEIITGKYSYHLPLYRLQDYFGGCGWVPSRGTQCNILANSFEIADPLLRFFKSTLQTDDIVGCDDTGVTLLYPKTLPTFDLSDPKQRRMQEVFAKAINENQPSINSKMWAYRGLNVKLNVFDFTVSRHRDGPELFFADYEGTLLGDCWHGFEGIAGVDVAVVAPVALPMVNSPSVSESRLIRMSPCNAFGRRPRAPSIPSSSFTVNSASMGPSDSVFDCRIAIVMVMPLPSSAARLCRRPSPNRPRRRRRSVR